MILDKVITPSTLAKANADEQEKNILNELNRNIKKSAFTTTTVRSGHRLNPGEYLLGQLNNRAELHAYTTQKITTSNMFEMTVTNKIEGTVKLSQDYFTLCGSHYVNVPPGNYAKAFMGSTPVLLGQGPHVIHNSNFKFDPKSGFIDQSAPYIQHGVLHILRVPQGSVATVWVDNEAKILEARKEPYVYNTAFFKLERNSQNNSDFWPANSKKIEHGSLKRIIPDTGEVAIVYEGGKLSILKPNEKGEPHLLTSQNARFDAFLQTNLLTCEFPSEQTKKQRQAENKSSSQDQINYEIFTTRDGAPVGVTLLVTYTISDPEKALKHLSRKDIPNHIEKLTVADMNRVMQGQSSQDFASSQYTISTPDESKNNEEPSAPYLHLQDTVRKQLATDLVKYGITLERLSIESARILDPELVKKMAEQNAIIRKTETEQAISRQTQLLADMKAKQETSVEKIKQEGKNVNELAAAKTTLETTRCQAEAKILSAQAEYETMALKGKLYSEFPILAQLEFAKIYASMYSGGNVNFNVSGKEYGELLRTGPMFFANGAMPMSTSPLVNGQQVESKKDLTASNFNSGSASLTQSLSSSSSASSSIVNSSIFSSNFSNRSSSGLNMVSSGRSSNDNSSEYSDPQSTRRLTS